ncbi:hypothetical protein AVEN_118077-1, partial [Araneus ventricosus]
MKNTGSAPRRAWVERGYQGSGEECFKEFHWGCAPHLEVDHDGSQRNQHQ